MEWLKNMGCPRTKLTLAEFSSKFRCFTTSRDKFDLLLGDGFLFDTTRWKKTQSTLEPIGPFFPDSLYFHSSIDRHWSWYDGNQGHQSKHQKDKHKLRIGICSRLEGALERYQQQRPSPPCLGMPREARRYNCESSTPCLSCLRFLYFLTNTSRPCCVTHTCSLDSLSFSKSAVAFHQGWRSYRPSP